MITDPDGAAISLTFTTFDTEAYWDTLELYNASSSSDALNMTADLSGVSLLSEGPLTITSGGHMFALQGTGLREWLWGLRLPSVPTPSQSLLLLPLLVRAT